MTRALAPGLALSYVNRIDGRVHLHLHLPRLEPARAADRDVTTVRVRLVKGGRSRSAPAAATAAPKGVLIDATLPPGRLANGAWQIRISPKPGAPFTSIGARVVVSDPNPISLLIGPAPESVIPAPVHTRPRRQRVAGSLGRVADRALTELPPQRADHARQVLRRLARTVLSR